MELPGDQGGPHTGAAEFYSEKKYLNYNNLMLLSKTVVANTLRTPIPAMCQALF